MGTNCEKRFKYFKLLCLVALLSYSSIASAESFNPKSLNTQLHIKKQIKNLLLNSQVLAKRKIHAIKPIAHLQGIEPIKIEFNINGTGYVRAFFTHQNIMNPKISIDGRTISTKDDSLPLLLQGYATVGRSSQNIKQEYVPISLDIINNNISIHIVSNKRGRANKARAFSIRSNLLKHSNKISAKLSSIPSNTLTSHRCANVSESEGISHNANVVSQRAAVANDSNTKLLKLDLVGDAEWHSFYGSNSAAQILALVNSADLIYRRDINLGLIVEDIQILTTNPTSLSSNDSVTLLEGFTSYISANPAGGSAVVGNKHLLTGKDLVGSTIGIAYISSACNAFATGLTQRLNSSTYLIFSHELGHNMGMEHVSDGGIMNSSLNNTNYFSSTSISSGKAFVGSTSQQCMPLEGNYQPPAPTATPTRTPTQTATYTPTNNPVIPPFSPTAVPTPVTPIVIPPQAPPPGVPTLSVPPVSNSSLLTINLKARKYDLIIKGIFLDANLPVSKANISLYLNNREVNNAMTNSKGIYKFRLKNKLTGKYRVATLLNGKKISSTQLRHKKYFLK